MPSIYEFRSYHEYLSGWIAGQPNKGRGLKSQMALKLGVSSTLISFILSGRNPLTLEQASDIADFVGLNESETDYLFLLVEFERAGTHRLKTKLERRMTAAQIQSKKVTKRLKKDVKLSDELKAIYYSSWSYTGIRNLVATGEYKDAASLARRLNTPLSTVNRTLQFLIENRLCIERDGHLATGPTYTHVDSDSPFVNKHRQNWRLRGFTMMEQKNEADLFYVSPMSISIADAEKVRAMILQMIQDVVEVMRPSPSEKVCCLNIDWFEY